jgi:hypothetical protein
MVSRSESAAIDNFRFKERLPSRAEAIRRLIELGLQAAADATMPHAVGPASEARSGPDAPADDEVL